MPPAHRTYPTRLPMAEKMHHSVNPMTIRDRETNRAPHSADAVGEVRPPNPVEDPRERLPTGPAHHEECPQRPRPLRTWVRSPGQANPTPRVNAPPIRMRSVCLGAAQPVCRFPGLLDAAAPFASPGSTALPALLASPSTAIQPRPAAIRPSLKRACVRGLDATNPHRSCRAGIAPAAPPVSTGALSA